MIFVDFIRSIISINLGDELESEKVESGKVGKFIEWESGNLID
jgi:hypothetical protein